MPHIVRANSKSCQTGSPKQLTTNFKTIVDKIQAEMLLIECRGDEIWSVETCQAKGIPQVWITELQDCFESGFDADHNTIYENGRMVNQYHGIPDLMIAYRLAEYLGINTSPIRDSIPGRISQVNAMKAELDEI